MGWDGMDGVILYRCDTKSDANNKLAINKLAPKTFEIELILKELLSDARFSSDYLGAKL